MSKNPHPSTSISNKIGPDFFGFYSNEVAQLLSRDEGCFPFFNSTHLVGNDGEETKCSTMNGKTKEHNGVNGFASFSNGVGALLSDSKKERLKPLLRESVLTLSKEVDEMIDPVLSICRIQSCLECKEELLSFDGKVDQSQQSHKRLKREFPNQLKNGSVLNSDTKDKKERVEIDDDLRFLLESDTTKVEELVKNQSNEFLDTLNHMEQKLEEMLNNSMTSCRSMTMAEKLKLRKSIQSLPPRNLDRVVEMIRTSEKFPNDEVHVDLEGTENATLWRLHFYVATVQGTAG